MPSPWRPALISAVAVAALIGGGTLVAQMESGDRVILPIDSSGTLEIGGIKVDVAGKDAAEARFAGWRIAQREGFKALWAKTNGRPISEAPTLSDSVLDSLVASIVVQNEQIGPNRYIAELGILFDRTRAGALLGVGGPQQRSAPMLLIPLTTTAGSVTSVELKNAWQRAWAQYRTSQSAIDYVRVSGMGADPLLVNAAQARRPGRGWWRNIIDFYGASNVLVAEVSAQAALPRRAGARGVHRALRPRRRPAWQLRADRAQQRRHSAHDGRGRRADGRVVHAARSPRGCSSTTARSTSRCRRRRSRRRKKSPSTSRSIARWR